MNEKVRKETYNLIEKKENELVELEDTEKEINERILESKQEVINLKDKLRHNKAKVSYCPSCGMKCVQSVGILFRCNNQKCEDFQTEWEWDNLYHGGLRRH